MSVNLNDLTIGIDSDLISPTMPNYRPPSWPPPRDWPVVIDRHGLVVSRWGDLKWDFTLWAGKSCVINFGDSYQQPEPLDGENADLLRMIATWFIWGPDAVGAVRTVITKVGSVRNILALCSRNGISAATLMRFPRVLEQVPDAIAPSKYDSVITLLHRLYDARATLGFVIVDQTGLRKLAEVAPDHNPVQTAYIPPRIWLYQVTRLRECLTDFLAHRDQVEACFQYCLDGYVKNHGSLEAALSSKKIGNKSPFNQACVNYPGCVYLGNFGEIAARFEINELLSKWIDWDGGALQVRVLSYYLSLVTFAGLAYIANFTLQRQNEVASLRSDCLLWEGDEKLGRVPIICGETTKTDPDSDARWVASPSVDVAIEAMSAIAHLRMVCDRANPLIRPSSADEKTPFLFSTPTEPWGKSAGSANQYAIRPHLMGLHAALNKSYPRLFDLEQLKIRGEDMEVARRLTPNLPAEVFAVGKVWPLAWHQYRRTGAVNMFASDDVSDSTMQQQMKHSTRLMSLYYGCNHSRLHLNKDVESAVVLAMYQAQAEMIKSAARDDRYMSPHSAGRKEALAINVLSAKDAKDLIAMAKKGTISFRENRLGGCMKAGACEYGGIESVARCGGGDGAKPCSEVLYDRKKEPQIRADLKRVMEEIKLLPAGHPRHNALLEEQLAMENFLHAISN